MSSEGYTVVREKFPVRTRSVRLWCYCVIALVMMIPKEGVKAQVGGNRGNARGLRPRILSLYRTLNA